MRYLALLITALVVAAPAFAHGGEEPTLRVPLDHVVQGHTFRVIGADLDATSAVVLRLGDRRVGTARTDDEGHFKATVVAPRDIADGYVELTATSADGESATTLVRFGSAPVVAAGSRPAHDGFPILAAVLIGLAAVAAATGGYLLLRR